MSTENKPTKYRYQFRVLLLEHDIVGLSETYDQDAKKLVIIKEDGKEYPYINVTKFTKTFPAV